MISTRSILHIFLASSLLQTINGADYMQRRTQEAVNTAHHKGSAGLKIVATTCGLTILGTVGYYLYKKYTKKISDLNREVENTRKEIDAVTQTSINTIKAKTPQEQANLCLEYVQHSVTHHIINSENTQDDPELALLTHQLELITQNHEQFKDYQDLYDAARSCLILGKFIGSPESELNDKVQYIENNLASGSKQANIALAIAKLGYQASDESQIFSDEMITKTIFAHEGSDQDSIRYKKWFFETLGYKTVQAFQEHRQELNISATILNSIYKSFAARNTELQAPVDTN